MTALSTTVLIQVFSSPLYDSLNIKIDNRELKEADHFKNLGSVLTRDGYCTKGNEIENCHCQSSINRKISLFTSKLNTELGRNWLGVMFGTILYIAQRSGP